MKPVDYLATQGQRVLGVGGELRRQRRKGAEEAYQPTSKGQTGRDQDALGKAKSQPKEDDQYKRYDACTYTSSRDYVNLGVFLKNTPQ